MFDKSKMDKFPERQKLWKTLSLNTYIHICTHLYSHTFQKNKTNKTSMLIVLKGKFYRHLKKTSGIQVLLECRDENIFNVAFIPATTLIKKTR
jgi:hypothetical protein